MTARRPGPTGSVPSKTAGTPESLQSTRFAKVTAAAPARHLTSRKGTDMRFKRAVQRYGRTPEPETPYQRAGQVWDARIGSARAQARNWRLMALGGLALST